MRKKLIYIIITTVLCSMAYLVGISHTEATTATPTKTEAYTEPYTDTVPLDQCIPLEDIACYHIDDSGFICIELKDIQHQLDDTHNNAYMDVLEGLEDATTTFYDRYVDMDTVTGYSGIDTGLMIYTDDGNGYFLEVGMMD